MTELKKTADLQRNTAGTGTSGKQTAAAETSGRQTTVETANIEKELRRYRSALRISGFGVALLSLWNMVKMFLYVFLDSETYTAEIEEIAAGDSELFFTVFIFVILAVDLIIRTLVCRRAAREAAGKKCGPGYIVFGFAMILLSVYSIADYVISDMYNLLEPDTLASVFIEITAFCTLVQMVYSALKVRKLSGLLSESVKAAPSADAT